MLPHIHNDAEACVEAVLSQVGRKIVLAMPIAIGKPNHFVNALYGRAVRDKSISLKIFTALSFVKPTLKSDLERRFAGPLVERIFGHFPSNTRRRCSAVSCRPTSKCMISSFRRAPS
jgi:hypothetical protein